ncbi:MAG: hypothetical protein ABFD92_14645 [Planctomycetaceae bacterium]|nr:hypothetical protein [Planctomycetaceae bacterium]
MTLLEALLASTILAACAFAVTTPFAASAQNDQTQQRWTLATCLAQEMMEEILSKPFKDPQGSVACGPDSGEGSRMQFDNVDDYQGFTETAGHIADAAGAVCASDAAAGLSRRVTVEYVYLPGQQTQHPASFARVIVEVRHLDVPVITLTRLVYDMGQ